VEAAVGMEKEPHREGSEVVRPDLNIERWQLFATSQFKGNSRILVRGEAKVIIGRVRDGSEKRGYREVGVLRIPEMKCFYALVKLWEKAGRPWEESVKFSLHEIAKILRMSWGGNTFALIEEWLDRLKKIPIDWMNAYHQKDLGITESVLQSFTLLSDLTIYKRSVSGQLRQVLSSFKFHERVLRNLLEHYTKPLNLPVLLSFKKEISVLLYRHLDLVMADKDRYERTTAGLLLEDLQLEGNRYRYPSRRVQVLEPALQELEGVELSTGRLAVVRLERTADGRDWKAVFEKVPSEGFSGSRRGRADRLSRPEQEAEARALVEEMLRILGDERSRPFYTKLARQAVGDPRLQDLIYRCLSEVKEEEHEGWIRTTKGAVFVDKLKRYCQEWGIDLGLKGS